MMAAVMAVAIGANAQKKEYPKQEEMKPGMSEYWTPQPKIVTPGDEKTSSAPDDAIVLFDGKDLSAWTNGNGKEEAGWTVKKGIMTVDKSKGDIKTKEKFGSFQLHLEWRVPEGITGESQAPAVYSCRTSTRCRFWTTIRTRPMSMVWWEVSTSRHLQWPT